MKDAASGPLRGLKVLDLGTIFAGPMVGAHLADLGADVIKVEPPRGDDTRRLGSARDGISMWWKVVNRNKRLAAIDLARPEGQAILQRLATEADVVVENFRPGKLEALGLGYPVLRGLNARIVLLHISGYGRTGPYRDRPGFGTLAEAFSGVVFMNGEPSSPPSLLNFPVADTLASLLGTSAVLAALRERDASGEGQEIDLNLYESLMTLTGNMLATFTQCNEVPRRQGNRSSWSVPRNAYATADGHWVVISSTTDAMAHRVFRAIGREDLAADPSLANNQLRARRAAEIDAIVAAWVATRTRGEALERLQAFDVPASSINDAEQFVNDPHVRAVGSLASVADPDFGTMQLPNVAARFSRTPGRIRWAGRSRIGADTGAVLKEAGYPQEVIDAYAESGVVKLGDTAHRKQSAGKATP